MQFELEVADRESVGKLDLRRSKHKINDIEHALSLKCFRDVLDATHSDCHVFVTASKDGLHLYSEELEGLAPSTVKEESCRMATAVLMTCLSKEEPDIDCSELCSGPYLSYWQGYQVLTSALLQRIFDAIDRKLYTRIRSAILSVELPMCEEFFNEVDISWTKLQECKNCLSGAKQKLPFKQSQYQIAQLAVEVVRACQSPEQFQNGLLSLLSKYSRKTAADVPLLPIPFVGVIENIVSAATEISNKLSAKKSNVHPVSTLDLAARELALFERCIDEHTSDISGLEETCKNREKEIRFQESQSRRDVIKLLMPPISFDEVSWTKWAGKFVAVVGGGPSLAVSMVEAGRRDPLAIARTIEHAWKLKVAVFEQIMVDQQQVIQAHICEFPGNHKGSLAKGLHINGSQMHSDLQEAKVTLAKAGKALEAAQHAIEELFRAKLQIDRLILGLLELGRVNNFAVDNGKLLHVKWTEFWVELRNLETLATEALAPGNESMETLWEAQRKATEAYIAMEKNYALSVATLQRGNERAVTRFTMDNVWWSERNNAAKFDHFCFPVKFPSSLNSTSPVTEMAEFVPPPELADEVVEELGRTQPTLEQSSGSSICSTAATNEKKYPSVEMLVISMSDASNNEDRWNAREILDKLSTQTQHVNVTNRTDDVCRDSKSLAGMSRVGTSDNAISFRKDFLDNLSGSLREPCETSQIILAEEELARLVREADNKRIIAGGVPFPENPKEDPADILRLEHWRLADQAVVSYYRNLNQLETPFTVGFIDEQWNVADERQRIGESSDQAELRLTQKKYLACLSKQKLAAPDKDIINDLLTSSQAASLWQIDFDRTLECELDRKPGTELDKAVNLMYIKACDQASIARWQEIKLMSRQDRQMKVFEYYAYANLSKPAEEKEPTLSQIELAWLYAFERHEEAARFSPQEAAEVYNENREPWDMRVSAQDRKIYNEATTTSNLARRQVFCEELAAAKSRVDHAAEELKSWRLRKNSKLAATKAAYNAQVRLVALCERDLSIRWPKLTQEAKSTERQKEFTEKLKCATYAYDFAKVANTEESWREACEVTRNLMGTYDLLTKFVSVSAEVKTDIRSWKIKNDIACSKYAFALAKHVWKASAQAINAFLTRASNCCDAEDVNNVLSEYNSAFRWTSQLKNSNDGQCQLLIVDPNGGLDHIQLLATTDGLPELPNEAFEAKASLQYLAPREWLLVACKSEALLGQISSRTSETEVCDYMIMNQEREITRWANRAATNADEVKRRARRARGTLWEKEEQWAAEVSGKVANFASRFRNRYIFRRLALLKRMPPGVKCTPGK
jgi:hypothetical protein